VENAQEYHLAQDESFVAIPKKPGNQPHNNNKKKFPEWLMVGSHISLQLEQIMKQEGGNPGEMVIDGKIE